MDVLVMLEENPGHSPVLAHVNSVPSPLNSERPSRDVVTLYGTPTPESLALALAAAVESSRSWTERSDTIRHLGVWPERGAVGDAAWRDGVTGQLMTCDLEIPLAVLDSTARMILVECEPVMRRLLAGLSMPDWPEGTRRAISFTINPVFAPLPANVPFESLLDMLRESEGLTFNGEGD